MFLTPIPPGNALRKHSNLPVSELSTRYDNNSQNIAVPGSFYLSSFTFQNKKNKKKNLKFLKGKYHFEYSSGS